MNIGRGKRSMSYGYADLIDSAHYIARGIQAGNRRVLMFVDDQVTVIITLRTKFPRKVGTRMTAEHRVDDIKAKLDTG